MDQNEKHTKHGWHAIIFIKNVLWFLNFKNHVNYIISAPQYFFWFNFGTKNHFLKFFSLWLRRERERERKIVKFQQ
jgi:hypothetical protein